MKKTTITNVYARTDSERAKLLEIIGLASSGFGVQCSIKGGHFGELEIDIEGRDDDVNRANSFLYNELINQNRQDNLN